MSRRSDNIISTQFGQPSQVLGQCRSQLNKFLDVQIQTVMEKVDDSMFRHAEQADNSSDQNLYFDAMRMVRLKRDQVSEQFRQNISELFNDFLHGRFREKASQNQAPAELELSLVENDSLEGDLAIEGMSKKARAVNADALYCIRRRLESLTARRELPDEVIPMDPGVLAEAFREPVNRLELPIKVNLIVLKLFEQHVLNELGDVYARINELLIGKGLLPDLQPPKPEQTGTYQRPSIPEPGGQPAGTEDTAEVHDVFSRLQQAVQSPATGSGPWPAPGVTGGLQGSGPWPAAQVGAGGPAGTGGGTGSYAVPPQGGVVAATPDVISALSALQHQPVSGEQLGAENLKDNILTTVSEVRGVAIQGIDPVEQSTIDIVSMLFDFIFDDDAVPDTIKVLIGRLQIPAIKVAVLDKGFFARKNNPARKLLNTLSKAGEGWVDDGSEAQNALLEQMEKTINLILDQFEDNVDIFEQALVEFEEFLQEQQEQSERHEDQAAKVDQGRENLAIAKAVAKQSIEQLLDNNELPEEVAQFLRTTWKDLLIILYVRNGSESEVWKKVLNIAVTLVWSLQPKTSNQERQELSNTLPALLKSIGEGMRRMSVSEESQQQLLDVLAREHTRLSRAPEEQLPEAEQEASEVSEAASETQSEPESETVVSPDEKDSEQPAEQEAQDGVSFLQRKVAEINQMIESGSFRVTDEIVMGDDADAPPTADEFVDQAREMPDGTWLEYIDEDNQTKRMKLSWRSMISGKLFFVNRQGMKVQEMTVYGLAARLRGKQVKVLDSAPVLDRAIDRLFSSAQQTESPA